MTEKQDIINYIEDKKNQRKKSLLGIEMTEHDIDIQNNMFLGVDMVIRWIKEWGIKDDI